MLIVFMYIVNCIIVYCKRSSQICTSFSPDSSEKPAKAKSLVFLRWRWRPKKPTVRL